jgi:uncharacterized protein YdeI (YjbR/CyaY-like superfamily)
MKNPKVDMYLSKAKIWLEEMQSLRTIILDCGLTEEIKWGKPCYSYQQRNVVIIQGFKSYCALLFFKGALLEDPHGMLIKAGENSRVGRQIRFSNVEKIIQNRRVLKDYLQQAIEVEKSGMKVTFEDEPAFKFPVEFQSRLDQLPALETAFHSLTPGRQRAYYLYLSAPKLAKTREARVEKCMKQILQGKGLDD